MTARDYSKFVSPLPHPGEHLREDFLSDYSLTAGSLAKAMGLRDPTRIERFVREAQPAPPDPARRLARVFRPTADFWMNLQAQHDLSATAIKSRRALKAIKPLEAA